MHAGIASSKIDQIATMAENGAQRIAPRMFAKRPDLARVGSSLPSWKTGTDALANRRLLRYTMNLRQRLARVMPRRGRYPRARLQSPKRKGRPRGSPASSSTTFG